MIYFDFHRPSSLYDSLSFSRDVICSLQSVFITICMFVARAASGHNGCAGVGGVNVAACPATDGVVRAALGWIWCHWGLDGDRPVGRLAGWGDYNVGGVTVGESDVVCRALCARSRFAAGGVGGHGHDQSGVDGCFGGRAGTVCRLMTWPVGCGSWVVWRWVAGGVSVGFGGVASVVIWDFRARVGRFGWADNFDLSRSGGHNGGVGGDGEVGAVVGCSGGSSDWRAAGNVICDCLGAGGCASVSKGVGRSSCARAVCLGRD